MEWRAKGTEDPFSSPHRTSAAEDGANLTLQTDFCLNSVASGKSNYSKYYSDLQR